MWCKTQAEDDRLSVQGSYYVRLILPVTLRVDPVPARWFSTSLRLVREIRTVENYDVGPTDIYLCGWAKSFRSLHDFFAHAW
jgi:hypothetical protein